VNRNSWWKTFADKRLRQTENLRAMDSMKRHKIPTIVFGGGINGLGIVRNLGREGINVCSVVDRFDGAIFSKYCKKHYLLPDYKERKDEAKSFLTNFSRSYTTRAVIFATDDIGTLVLADLKSDLKDDYYFVLPEKETVEKLVVKRRFYQSLSENRVPHPKVVIPTKPGDLEDVERELGYPIFIRPSISEHFSMISRKKGFIANSKRELIKYLHLVSRHNIDVICQEIIPGGDDKIYGIAGLLNRESKPLALFAYHRLRGWPPVFGNCSMIESLPLSDVSTLKETTTTYLRSLDYYGIMECEFKQDCRDGDFKMLEINARSWWQNSFPTKCGLNIVLAAYLDAIGETVDYNENYLTGLKWTNFINDVVSSVRGMDIFKKNWLGTFHKVRDFAFFDIHDPAPAVVNSLYQLSRFVL
jgi:D-aspartate ligase